MKLIAFHRTELPSPQNCSTVDNRNRDGKEAYIAVSPNSSLCLSDNVAFNTRLEIKDQRIHIRPTAREDSDVDYPSCPGVFAPLNSELSGTLPLLLWRAEPASGIPRSCHSHCNALFRAERQANG